MIIEKLNAICHRHSRWLFGSFTVIIIISFLGFLTPGQFGVGFGDPRDAEIGRALGEKVTYKDILRKKHELALEYRLFYGMVLDSDRVPDEQVFWTICLDRKAEKLGIVIPDSEVVARLKMLPFFADENGKYDPTKYPALIRSLAQQGFSEADLINALRTQLRGARLWSEIEKSVTVSDSEAKSFYRFANTVFSGKLYEFPAPDAEKIPVDEAALRKYFDAHRDKYQIEGKVSAKVVIFPIDAEFAKLEKQVTDADLEKFFNDNRSNYPADKDFAAQKAEVRKNYLRDYVKMQAIDNVQKTAYEFASTLYNELDGLKTADAVKIFIRRAAEQKLQLKGGSAAFSADQIAGIKSAELVKRLAATGEPVPMTNPVVSEEGVYVGFADSIMPTRNAEFSEALKDVTRDYRQAEVEKRVLAHAEETVKKAQAAADAAARSAVFAADPDCKISDLEFSLATKLPPAGLELAAQQMSQLAVGEVSGVLPGIKGAPVAVQLFKRTAPDMSKFEAEKAQYLEKCRKQKLALATEQFKESLAKECSYTGISR